MSICGFFLQIIAIFINQHWIFYSLESICRQFQTAYCPDQRKTVDVMLTQYNLLKLRCQPADYFQTGSLWNMDQSI